MTTVSVTNISPGVQSYKSIDNRDVVLAPGETRKIEMHPYHVMLLERPVKGEPVRRISMTSEEREAHGEAMLAIANTNKVLRTKAYQPTATPAQKSGVSFDPRFRGPLAVPNIPKNAMVDRRFMIDPQTVAPPQVTTTGVLVPPLTGEEAAKVLQAGALEATPKAVVSTSRKKKKTEVADTKKKLKKVPRVVLKDNGDDV